MMWKQHFERGWSTLQNGQLLDAAKNAGFDVFVVMQDLTLDLVQT